MTLLDRYEEIKGYCTEEEYKGFLQRISTNKAKEILDLNAFDFLITVPEEVHKRNLLSDILKELYDKNYMKALVYSQNPLLKSVNSQNSTPRGAYYPIPKAKTRHGDRPDHQKPTARRKIRRKSR